MDVSASEALNTNTFTYADLTLTRDDATNNLINNTVTIQLVSSNLYRIQGLASLTEAPGNYRLTINAAGLEDRAGNAGVGSISNAWQRLGLNTAPQLALILNQSIEEKNLLTLAVTATDADSPTNVLTFSLDPIAPSGAAIDPVTGVFTWTPADWEYSPGPAVRSPR